MQLSKETMVYECPICHKLYYDKSKADYCCQDRTCSTCGEVIGKISYYTICGSCKSKKERERERDFFDASDFEPFDKPKSQPIITELKVDLLFDKPVIEENRDEVYIYSGRSTIYINLSLGTYGVATLNSNELKSYSKEIGESLAYRRAFVRFDEEE